MRQLSRTTLTLFIFPADRHDEWREAVERICDAGRLDDIVHDIACRLQSIIDMGRTTSGRSIARAMSALHDSIQERFQDIRTPHVDRLKLRQQLYKERGRIQKERRNSQFSQVLKELQKGGWGKTAMQNLPDMQELMHDNGTKSTKNTACEEIGRHATMYYSTLFAVQDEDEDALVESYTKRTYDPTEHAVNIGAEQVHTATLEARRRRTCAKSDRLVAEMCQAATSVSERWAPALAWAFNRRLQNTHRSASTRRQEQRMPHMRATPHTMPMTCTWHDNARRT